MLSLNDGMQCKDPENCAAKLSPSFAPVNIWQERERRKDDTNKAKLTRCVLVVGSKMD
jgi:hypothetical protein